MSFPNYITLSRIIAAPILWYLIYSGNKQAFAWLLTYAFFTDLIDGVIARKMRRVSALGSKLDSWGDSITILSGLAGLLVFEWELLKQYGVIVSVVFALHLLQLLLSLWRYKKPSSFHTWTAKTAALGIGMFMLITLHFGFYEWLFYISIGLLIADALEETILIFLLPNWEHDVKGIYWVMRREEECRMLIIH
ncbi:MAG: CDP-alcohol phosphatidyltransferase family protein [Bacteroidetes bacterium]|nr:CDP-alcohol phosphatidyltransferase family protein [Bacteroidota bacterium]